MTDKDLQINGPSKSASKVPSPDKVELKKKRRMAHVVDPMKMSRELFVDDESYATYQQQLKLMEHAAKGLVDQFADVEAEKDDLTTCVRKMENEKGKMEYEKANLESQLMTAQAELDARPYIEFLQRKVMPRWLLNDEDVIWACKWEFSIEFGVSKTARILKKRIQELNPKINVKNVSNLLANSYDTFSNLFEHKKKVRPLIMSDDAWQAFFKKVGIDDETEQNAFKSLVQPISDKEYKEIVKDGDKKQKFTFLVKYLNIDLRHGENAVSDKIRKMFPGYQFTDFFYPTDKNEMYTNMVIFLVEQCTKKNAHDLYDLLANFPKPGCFVNTKYDVYDPDM